MDIISFTFNSIAVAVIVFATVAVAFTVCNIVLGCIGNKVIHGKSIMNTDKIYAEQIANEYAPKDTSKVVKLKKLDSKAKMPATIFTYSFGIISALVLGVGMCLTMGEIGNGTTVSMVFGIIIGVIGMIGMGVNYPIYKRMLENGKKKYAFEIMELAKEISEQE